MDILLAQLSVTDWILIILFIGLGILSLLKGVNQVFSSAKFYDTHEEKLRIAFRIAPWYFGFGLSLMIIIGIVIGLPISDIRCWLLIFPMLCFLSPFVLIYIIGMATQLWWQDRFLDQNREIRSGKGRN